MEIKCRACVYIHKSVCVQRNVLPLIVALMNDAAMAIFFQISQGFHGSVLDFVD